MSERDFQATNFRLRNREYKYYYAANKDRLDRVPDLSDMSGGLSNPVLFNFVYYIAWKAACARLQDENMQQEFSDRFGDALLDALAPDARAAVQAVRGDAGAANIPCCLSCAENSGDEACHTASALQSWRSLLPACILAESQRLWCPTLSW